MQPTPSPMAAEQIKKLEDTISILQAYNEVLSQTVNEVIAANIQYKTSNKLLAKVGEEATAALQEKEMLVAQLNAEAVAQLQEKDTLVVQLNAEIARLKRVVETLDMEIARLKATDAGVVAECDGA